ncbi:hypothetical protein [Bradyrhizobium sp. USDA 4451]
MPPKAYDDDQVEYEVIPRHGRDLLAPDPHSYEAVFAPIHSVGLGEILTVLTLLYVCTITAFNAAYFANVPGNFVEFFSLTDLIQTNLPIIQYFFQVFITYTLVASFFGFVCGMAGVDIPGTVRNFLEPFIVDSHIQPRKFWLSVTTAIVLFWIYVGVMDAMHVTNFTARMIPTFIFQAVLLYAFWVGFKYSLVPARQLAGAAFIALFVCSNNAGHAWIKSQIADPTHIQAIQDKEGNCHDRNILRNSSSGLLLHNPSLNQFEFRSKDTIKTIFQNRGCV